MRYDYQCHSCGTINELEVLLSQKPADWQPPTSIHCQQCKEKATRIYGCDIGVQNNSDETKHIGKSTSGASNFQFVGNGFPDVDRRLTAEEKEIEEIMDEPPTRAEIEAGNQQMAELEREMGKTQGAISGEREMEDVEIVGVSDDEARRIAADEQQRLVGNIDQVVSKHAGEGFVSPTEVGPRRIAVPAGDASASSEYQLPALSEGEKVVKKIAKRRGKEKLKEEMQNNRMNRT